MRDELEYLKKLARPNSAIKTGRINWPNCDEIKRHRILPSDVSNTILMQSFYWINDILYWHKLGNADSAVLLTEMTHGDDWIVGRNIIDGQYVQYIDGRTFTVLIKGLFELTNREKILAVIKGIINKYIRRLAVDLELHKTIFICYDSLGQVEAKITKKSDTNSIVTRLTPKIWLNKNYIIFDIPKVRTPYYDKFGFDGPKTLNCISLDDERSFKRFRKSGNINMEEEMIRQFPWVLDTMAAWKKHINNHDGGQPPVYDR